MKNLISIHSKKNISNSEIAYVSDLLKTNDTKKNLLTFEINSKKRIVLISIKSNLKISEIENLGAKFFTYTKQEKNNSEYFLISDTIAGGNNNFLGHFLHGVKLKSYEFNKYKSKKNNKLLNINIVGTKNIPSTKNQLKFKALEEGTFFTRDLVSEPGNILHPMNMPKD